MGKRFHYTYRVKFPYQGWWYWGKHSTDDLNDGYCGSPCTHKEKWKLFYWEMEILEFFETELECRLVEKRLIDPDLNNPSCLNEHSVLALSLLSGDKGRETQITDKVGIFNPEHQDKLRELGVGLYDPEVRERGRKAAVEHNRLHKKGCAYDKDAQRRGGQARAKVLSKEVKMTNIDSGEATLFPSISSAARELGLHGANISKVIYGELNRTRRYTPLS